MRPRLSSAWAVACGLLASFATAETSSIAAHSRIDRVTIYADRADVERVAERVALQAGVNRILFPGLSRDLDPGSVRARGSGGADMRILNVDLRRENLEVPEDAPEIERLREEREEVEREMRALRAKKDGLDTGYAFLESVRVRQSLEAGELLTATGLDPERLAVTLAFLTEKVGSNRREKAELEVELAELQKRWEGIDRELKERRAVPEKRPWTAEVEVESERPGHADLAVTYSTRGARWAPTYDVIVSEDLEAIEIVYAADVEQRTGEDWSDAEITLSSAQPGLGADLPTLEPWWLRLPEDLIRDKKLATEQEVSWAEIPPQRGGRKPEIRAMLPPASVALPALEMRASGLFATSFQVPVRQDLPSDGRSRRMRIGTVDVQGRVEHRSVPRRSPYVFLVASVTNSSELPLLGGPSRVILGGQFLGRGRLPDVEPGQDFDLSLGVDRAVSVRRQRVKRDIDASGERGRVEIGYRIDVENHRSEPIRLTLSDQIPLSPDEDVRVRTRDLAPEPDTGPDEDGFLIWTLEIPPDGEQRLEMTYELKFPREKVPVNLEG